MLTVLSLRNKKFPVRFLFLSVCGAVLGVIFVMMFGYDHRTKAYAEWNDKPYSTSAENIRDMQKLAENFGISIGCQPDSAETIRIPQEFNQLYNEYNALQKNIGMNLEPYKGEECTLYTFDVNDALYLNLIVYDGHFIGGDLSEKDWNGQMKSIG